MINIFLFSIFTIIFIFFLTFVENKFFQLITGKIYPNIKFIRINNSYKAPKTISKFYSKTKTNGFCVENIDSLNSKSYSHTPIVETTIESITKTSTPILDNQQSEQHGRWIGGLERSLIAIGIISGHWDVVSGVVAVKAVTRFKELDNKNWAEYFLIGSMMSILWAILFTFIYIFSVDYFFHDIGLNIHILSSESNFLNDFNVITKHEKIKTLFHI